MLTKEREHTHNIQCMNCGSVVLVLADDIVASITDLQKERDQLKAENDELAELNGIHIVNEARLREENEKLRSRVEKLRG